jgi:hypothetical protein
VPSSAPSATITPSRLMATTPPLLATARGRCRALFSDPQNRSISAMQVFRTKAMRRHGNRPQSWLCGPDVDQAPS